MSPTIFVHNLTNQIFIMLPWSDSEEIFEEMHMRDYIDSMVVQVSGGKMTFEILQGYPDYAEVENILHYLNCHEMPLAAFKREIKKALSLLNKIEKELGDASA